MLHVGRQHSPTPSDAPCTNIAIAMPTLTLIPAFVLAPTDPFADAIKGANEDVQDGLVHIRIQQRSGRKTLTTVQGLSAEYDLKKIVRACKKEFACNGTVVEHAEYGEVLQLQGDQRENICQWLTKSGLAKPEQLKVHGF